MLCSASALRVCLEHTQGMFTIDIFITTFLCLCDLNTRNRQYVRLNQPRTTSASISIRYKIPQLMLEIPECISAKISTHSIDGFCKYVKNHIISNYRISCEIENCYICEQAAET